MNRPLDHISEAILRKKKTSNRFSLSRIITREMRFRILLIL